MFDDIVSYHTCDAIPFSFPFPFPFPFWFNGAEALVILLNSTLICSVRGNHASSSD
jgi:hypothetical protein